MPEQSNPEKSPEVSPITPPVTPPSEPVVQTVVSSKKFELNPPIAILASGALIAAAIVFVHMTPTPQAPTTTQVAALPASVHIPAPSAEDHIVGSPTAPIVLVEYTDFQCPFCNMIYPSLKRLVTESNGQVAWVHRQLPLTTIHPQAMPAALASECIAEQLGNDGFWKFADTVFANQSKMTPAYYTQLAAQLGADSVKFASCVASGKYTDKINTQSADAQSNGGNGTPFTIVVGKGLQVPISGALPYEQLAAVIKQVQQRQ